jgi:hypothetical protein
VYSLVSKPTAAQKRYWEKRLREYGLGINRAANSNKLRHVGSTEDLDRLMRARGVYSAPDGSVIDVSDRRRVGPDGYGPDE